MRKEPSSKSGRSVLLPTRLLSSDTHSFFKNQSLSPSVFICQLSAQYKKIVTNGSQKRCHYRTQCKHVMLIALELVHCKYTALTLQSSFLLNIDCWTIECLFMLICYGKNKFVNIEKKCDRSFNILSQMYPLVPTSFKRVRVGKV